MSITIELSPAELELVKTQADSKNVSVEDFSREAVMKQAGNAAYMAKINRAIKNLDEGKGKFFTDKELEELFNGNGI